MLETHLQSATAPDLVVLSAGIWAPEPSLSSAIAVTDGRISAVGDDDSIAALIGPATERIDAAGAALLPGFHDAHIHVLAGGLGLTGCDLDSAHSLDGYERLIREYADSHAGEWVVGAGWFGDVFPGGFPDRALLDRLVPDRPAVFTSHDAHGVWVNTRALQLAAIDRHTPDPAAGRIVRDASGEATGMLMESAGELVTALIPPHRPADLRRAMLTAQDHLFSLGITSWHDAILGRYLTLPDCVPTYLETIGDGSLRARVTGSVWWPAGAGLEALDSVLGTVAECRAAGFPVDSVKIMQDGICENCTGALLAPYTGVTPETSGESVIPPELLTEIVTALDARGLRVHFHGVGDRAVRECLDAVEAARRHNGAGVSHQIAHIDVADPADLPRFAELGVTANLQPLWARADQEILERKLPMLGEQRARWHFPFGSLERAGTHLAMGSDWPVTSPDPLWGIYTACTRTAPPADSHARNPESREPMTPSERLSLESAVRAYTLGGAEIAGVADRRGRIAIGQDADLVLLSGPLSQPQDLPSLRVARTILGGTTVHRSSRS
ncbi:amidohydrolase [Leucobacter tardus]|uniref:amidohydrolase n=1 Tax=Leucobacter tardus TaxID=501483 RepID=UPI0027DC8FD0|nr:amidohydrolase [Leucobacter tardus]